MTKRIFVVGHMGAGKFIFTEALAKKLGWEIVDANPSIERYLGRQTREIIGEEGMIAYNRCQADVIINSIKKENIVILLEECSVESELCRKLLANEYVVYLKVSIPTQLGRMAHGRVAALPVEDMKQLLEKQHRDRDAFFEEVATLVVDSVEHPMEIVEINKIIDRDVDQVMKALKK